MTSNQSGKQQISSYGKAGWSNKRLNRSKGGSKGRSWGGSVGVSKGGSKCVHSNYYNNPKEWNAMSAAAKAKVCLKRQQSSDTDKLGSSDSRSVWSVDTDSDGNAQKASNAESNAGSQFGSNAYSKKQKKEWQSPLTQISQMGRVKISNGFRVWAWQCWHLERISSG